MLRSRFDPHKPLRVVLYLRMSSDLQNPRSPEQQRDTITKTIQQLGYPWIVIETFRDDAISGRYVRKRPGLQEMLRGITSGALQADCILVDTFERFGRAEELAGLRRRLYQQHGVLVLTADTHFEDPTSASGMVLAAFESLRSVEDNRIKSHNVLRGKRDAVRQKHWPGGAPPFGYRLANVFRQRNGRQELDHCVLEPDPETGWIVRKIFELAAERGWGCTRIARTLNADPNIPQIHKPFLDQTVNRWLKQEIYYGELVWERVATGIVDDRRITERNAKEDVVRVPDFCEPLITREVWETVQQIRQARSDRTRRARLAKARDGDKQIRAPAPGIVLNYLLTGLIRCGHCNRAMTVSSSVGYTTKAGETKRYVSYGCPGHSSGACENGTRVPEPWLREAVIELIRGKLFPLPK